MQPGLFVVLFRGGGTQDKALVRWTRVALAGVEVGAFGLGYGLFALVNALIPMRVTEHQEKRGLDDSQHGEKMG